ncbi:AAA family ATPase [Blastococcus sp. TF02-9]|uniref:AAA family ATPase n=1 Tax=Blastococcus sp. TF02-09 TaxID=2250576 RepID=UPI001314FD22|nr:AAA family ATPase [Blastococcus sp. TF02-9]
MQSSSEDVVQQHLVRLPNGIEITENGPVVIVGPNGSGKSRRSREITSTVHIEVVSALRNTKISPQLQPMALQQAKANFQSQRETARTQPYELTNDFDYMLTALIGEAAESSLEFLRIARSGVMPHLPPLTSLEKIQTLWHDLFPGRELRFRDYMPMVINTVAVGDEPAEYSAWQMSDGEKAALYLAGRTLGADLGAVILVDEPETHFHSLLAVQFWDAIENARPDLRLIYVTHDMTFAASRQAVNYLLANPKEGLTPIELAADSSDLAAILLGTATLSFYATHVIFCEGDSDALDARLYKAWFNTKETVVHAVGSCDMVLRSVSALSSSKLVQNLTVKGITDRDFHSEAHLNSLVAGVLPLKVHEVETLYCLPGVVAAVAKHLGVKFDRPAYEQKVISTFTDGDRHKVVLERWKVLIDAALTGVVSSVSTKTASLQAIAGSIPAIFDQSKWSFSPQALMADEKTKVESLFQSKPLDLDELLKVMPGKQLRGLPAGALGISPKTYDNLLINAIGGEDPKLVELGAELRVALKPYMPF